MNDFHQNAGAATARLAVFGLVTALASIYGFAAPTDLRSLFEEGSFKAVIERAPSEITNARKFGKFADAAVSGLYASKALIQLEKYDDAEQMLVEAEADAERVKADKELLASLLFAQAHLFRAKKDFRSASARSRDAFALAPQNREVELEYYVSNGRILFSSGYDISAIVWLEKAEAVSNTIPRSSLHLEMLRFLSLAWQSKFNYGKAISYSQKLVDASQNSEFKFRYRQALYEYGNLLSAAGQEQRAKTMYEKGLNLALSAKDDTQSSIFLSTLLLNALYQNDLTTAEKHVRTLAELDKSKSFEYDVILGHAIINALQDNAGESERQFFRLETMKTSSNFVVPYWKATIAERKHNWEKLIELSEILLRLAEKENFRENLPHFYLMLARGHWGLGEKGAALKALRKAEAIVTEARPTDDAPLSLSMLETFHSVYRLIAEVESDASDLRRSIETVDYLKARVLSDRINFSPLKQVSDFSPGIRKRANDLSSGFLNGDDKSALDDFEANITTAIPQNSTPAAKSLHLDNIQGLDNTAIVSYFFSLDGKLAAHVLETNKPIRLVRLGISEPEVVAMANSVRNKIMNRIFFKNDGKEIYGFLIEPLSLSSSHIVFVPDKSLWKIPFHALSPDGESYLIEKKMVSYSPSVSLLFESLSKKAPVRKKAQVFANNTFENRTLRFVNQEAATVGKLLDVPPRIGATSQQFFNLSHGADILHFSMHAQADREEPLDSFLGFKPSGNHNGRITVNDLLKIHLKPQNLAFIASCDTNNVLNGEGVVSIGWALLGSGSTTVISSQWEANDRSTGLFAQNFYKEYKKGIPAARALQNAAISMIRDKSSETYEPYYWASFTLLGDFR
ncbi:MAG: CHAT domain-containing protein [Acidobacteria bacterium]|nr:CHAT domain-containing protein [Acidobacteriota bacterium]